MDMMLFTISILFAFTFEIAKCWVYVDYGESEQLSDPNSKGEDVVQAAIAKLEDTMSYLAYDNTLMNRIALVESTFGEEEDVMQANVEGGIWQITQEIYDELGNDQNYSSTALQLLDDIQVKFGLDCFLCSFNFSTPLKSASAARLYIEFKLGSNVPSTLSTQRNWWAEHYHSGGNPPDFTAIVEQNENDYALTQTCDMWFVVDCSTGVTEQEFESEIQLCKSMAAQSMTHNPETRCGMSKLTTTSEIVVEFDDANNLDAFETALTNVERTPTDRVCSGLFEDILDFGLPHEKGARWDADETPNLCLMLFMDADCTDDQQFNPDYMKERNVTLFIIGVGSSLNKTKTREKAEHFGDTNAVFLTDFDELVNDDVQQDIFAQYCSTVAYTDDEVDLVCVMVCINFVEDGTIPNVTYTPSSSTSELEETVQNWFHIDCSKCPEINEARKTQLTQFYQDDLANSAPTNFVLLIRDFFQSITSAPGGAPTQDYVCSEYYKGDLYFLLIASSSMSNNDFYHVKNFTNDMSGKMNIDVAKVQLGLAKYAHEKERLYSVTDSDTDPLEYLNEIYDVTKYTVNKNMGSAVVEAIEQGFDSSSGGRLDEKNVKPSLVLITKGSSSDDLTTAQNLIEEKGLTVFVVSPVDESNLDLMNTLASEPKSKHAIRVESFDNISSSVVKNVLETIEHSPLDAARNESLTIQTVPGTRNEMSTIMDREKGVELIVNASDPSVTLKAYVKVGNSLVNPALHDAKFVLPNGTGEVFINPTDLLRNYPNITSDEVPISVAVEVNERVELKVYFRNDERSEEDKLLGDLQNLEIKCRDPSNVSLCIEQLDEKIFEAKDAGIDDSEIEDQVNLRSDLMVVEDVIASVEECRSAAEEMLEECVEKLEQNLTTANNLNINNAKIDDATNVLQDIRKEWIEYELNSTSEECSGVTSREDVSSCLERIEEHLTVADNFNIDLDQREETDDLQQTLNESLVVMDLEVLNDECKNSAEGRNLTLCVERIEDKLKEAEELNITIENVQESIDILQDAKQDLVIEEINKIKEECKTTAENQTQCYEDLKNKLEEATNLNVSEIHLEESYKDIEIFERNNEADGEGEIPGGDEGTSDFQTAEFALWWVILLAAAALLMSMCGVYVGYKKKKKKQKVKPDEKELEEIRIKLKALTEEAINPEATYECLQNLLLQIQIAEEAGILDEDLDNPKDALNDLQSRINDIREGLTATVDPIDETDLILPHIQQLEEKLAWAEYLKLPPQELENTQNAIRYYKDQLQGLEGTNDADALLVNEIQPTSECPSVKIDECEPTEVIEDASIVASEIPSIDNEEINKSIDEVASPKPEEGIEKEEEEEPEEMEELVLPKTIEPEIVTTVPEPEAEEATPTLDIVVPPDKDSVQIDECPKAIEKLNKLEEKMNYFKNAEAAEDAEENSQEALKAFKEELKDKPDEIEHVRTAIREKLKDAPKNIKGGSTNASLIQNLENEIRLAEMFDIPSEELEETLKALQEIKDAEETEKSKAIETTVAPTPKSQVEAVKEKLNDALVSGDPELIEEALVESKNLTESDAEEDEDLKRKMDEAEKQFVENLNNKPEEEKQARQEKVQSHKIELEEAINSDDPIKIEAALQHISEDKTPFVFDENETDLNDLVKIAKAKKQHIEIPSVSEKDKIKPETSSIKIGYSLPKDSSEEQAVEEETDEDRSERRRNQMRNALHSFMENMDLENIDTAGILAELEKQFGNLSKSEIESVKCDISRFRVILYLKRAIGFRSDSMIKEALKMKDDFLKENPDFDIEADEEMSTLVHRANDLLALFEQVERMKSVVMSLKQPTISEIRSYSSPPAVVRNVMEATFLLLGEEQGKLKSWQSIQALVGKTGKDALKRRIWERDLEFVELKTALSAGALLIGFEKEDVEVISKAGGVFYSWSSCVVQEVKDRQSLRAVKKDEPCDENEA